MMRRVLLFLSLCVWGAAVAPAFPPGVAEEMSAMNNVTKNVDTSNPDEEEVMKDLKEHAGRTLESDLLDSATALGLSQAAYVASRLRLSKLIFVGGCPRDFNAKCPVGWSENKAGTQCQPPEDYDGRCGASAAADLDAAGKKEEFSWKCRVSWGCRTSCRLDYTQCPEAWARIGKLCVAPGSYDGICSPAMDFSSYSSEDMLQWSMLCGAAWPCQGKQGQSGESAGTHLNGPVDSDAGVVVPT